MNISMGLRLRALLDLYLAQRKRRHVCISMRTLEGEWRRTGMRRDDLHLAVADAQQHHFLQVSTHGGYELTYIGEVAMLGKLNSSALSRLRDWATLRRLRLRLRRCQQDSRQERLLRRTGDALLPH